MLRKCFYLASSNQSNENKKAGFNEKKESLIMKTSCHIEWRITKLNQQEMPSL